MRRVLAVLSAVLAGVTMGACGGSKSDDKATATTLEVTTTTFPVPAAAAALEARLLKDLPSGYQQEDDRIGDTGPSDLAKAVRDDGSDNAQELLTTEGFVAGYQRLWTRGADDAIVDFVYQFKTAAGARASVQRMVTAAAQGDDTHTVTEFPVPGIPGARGFAAHSSEGDKAIVAFARGVYALQIVVNGAGANATFANSLATQQHVLAA